MIIIPQRLGATRPGFNTQDVPVRIEPLPGESMAGYVERVAETYTLSPRGLLAWLFNLDAAPTPRLNGVAMPPVQIASFAGKLRLEVGELEGLLLSRFAGGALPGRVRDAVTAAKLQQGSRTDWYSPGRSRFCPMCLAQGVGWQSKWHLSISYACTEHQVLLLDRCPRCASAAVRGRGVESVPAPRALVCVARPRDAKAEWCGQRLDEAPAPPLAGFDELIWAQRILDETLLPGGLSKELQGTSQLCTSRELHALIVKVAMLLRLDQFKTVKSRNLDLPTAVEEAIAADAALGSGYRRARGQKPGSAALAAAALGTAVLAVAGVQPEAVASISALVRSGSPHVRRAARRGQENEDLSHIGRMLAAGSYLPQEACGLVTPHRYAPEAVPVLSPASPFPELGPLPPSCRTVGRVSPSRWGWSGSPTPLDSRRGATPRSSWDKTRSTGDAPGRTSVVVSPRRQRDVTRSGPSSSGSPPIWTATRSRSTTPPGARFFRRSSAGPRSSGCASVEAQARPSEVIRRCSRPRPGPGRSLLGDRRPGRRRTGRAWRIQESSRRASSCSKSSSSGSACRGSGPTSRPGAQASSRSRACDEERRRAPLCPRRRPEWNRA